MVIKNNFQSFLVLEKILPTIFPSHVHVQPDMKLCANHMSQMPEIHVGSSLATSVGTEHFVTIAPQSHSPHLPNASNLSRHINIT